MLDPTRALGKSPRFGPAARDRDFIDVARGEVAYRRRHEQRSSPAHRSRCGYRRSGASLVATVLEPDWSGEPGKAVRVVADSELWNGNRLLDLIGLFLTVGALTVVGRTFAAGSGRVARTGQPFLVLMGALGAGAVLGGADMKEMADAWVGATPSEAVVHRRLRRLEDIDRRLVLRRLHGPRPVSGSARGGDRDRGLYARWIGWASAVAGGLVLSGLLVLVSESAFIAVLVGYVLYKAY